MFLYVCKQTFRKRYRYITREFLGLRRQIFQGIIFIWTRTYREIFKSALVYLWFNIFAKWHFLSIKDFFSRDVWETSYYAQKLQIVKNVWNYSIPSKTHFTSFLMFCRNAYIDKNYPAGNCIFNRNTRTRCELCSKLTIKTPERRQWRRSGVFIVNFEHISHLVLVFLLLTLNM